MRLPKVMTLGALAAILGAGAAFAQNLGDTPGPREFPPSSYSGKQYVDSDGCVFVRAGFAGQVTWVPRVGRDRKLICGYQPTLAVPQGTEVTVATAPSAASDRPATTPAATTPAATMPTATTATAPAAAETTASGSVRVATATTRTITRTTAPRAPRPSISAEPMRRPAAFLSWLFGPARTLGTASGRRIVLAVQAVPVWQTACPDATPSAQRFQLADGRRLVRCGSADVNPEAFVRRLDLARVPVVEVEAMPVRMSAKSRTAAPAGFKPAFEDGRFNPHRGLGTTEGQRRMELVWTNTVPRRLVEKRTGREVTRRQIAVSSKTAPESAAHVARIAPVPAARYVQVGTFGVPENASSVVASLQQKGLPVAISATRLGGKPVQVVLAGPFDDAGALATALTTARRSGFSDAFTRP